MIRTSKAIAISKIKKQISGIQTIHSSEPLSPQFKEWRKESEKVLENIFGNGSRQLKEFLKISYQRAIWDQPGSSNDHKVEQIESFIKGLDSARITLELFIKEIEEYWQEQDIESNSNSTVSLNEVVDLKPNFMGFGLNINMLIKKFFGKQKI